MYSGEWVGSIWHPLVFGEELTPDSARSEGTTGVVALFFGLIFGWVVVVGILVHF